MTKSTAIRPVEFSSPGDSKKRSGCDSPPAAPVAVKRKRYVGRNDDDEEEETGSEDEGVARIIRNLSDDFDRVAGESKKIIKKPIEYESVGKRLKVVKAQKVEETSSIRTPPRLSRIIPLRFRF